jgi:hypothetical protein
MQWTHSRIISVAEDGTAAVVQVDEGWDARPFGFDGGSSGIHPTREHAIEAVEAVLGEVICCVGHLAEDADG